MKLIDDFIPSLNSENFQSEFEKFKIQVENQNSERQKGIIRLLQEAIEKCKDDYQEYYDLTSTKLERTDEWDLNCSIVLNYCEEFGRSESVSIDKVKWNGDLRRFGAIFYKLIETEYISAPKRNNNKINFTELERIFKGVFQFSKKDVATLKDYLNPNDEKFHDDFYRSLNITHLNRHA
jgi:hypothetical protein